MYITHTPTVSRQPPVVKTFLTMLKIRQTFLCTYLTGCIFCNSTDNPLNSFNPHFQFHGLSPRRRGFVEADGSASVGHVHPSAWLGIPVKWNSNAALTVM